MLKVSIYRCFHIRGDQIHKTWMYQNTVHIVATTMKSKVVGEVALETCSSFWHVMTKLVLDLNLKNKKNPYCGETQVYQSVLTGNWLTNCEIA